MSRLSMSMNNFKKVRSDEHSTTLKHKDGHEIKVAHARISPKYRGQLDALPIHDDAPKMADGGMVADSSNQSASMKESYGKKSKKLEIESEPQHNKHGVEYEEIPMEHLDAERMAKGGEVRQSNPKLEESKKMPPMARYADGGEVAKDQGPITINVGQPQMNPAMINPEAGQQFASQQPHQMSPAEQAAVDPGSQPYGSSAVTEAPSQQAPQMAQPMASAPQAAPQQGLAPQNLEKLPGGMESDQGLIHGMGQETQGIQQEAAARGHLGQEQAVAEQAAQAKQQDLANTFHSKMQDIQSERQAMMHDIDSAHIDAGRYLHNMSTGSKIATGIGLILGGMGAGLTGTRNQVMDHLQNAIDNDIQAQKADLGKKENLLSFNFKKEGNLRDAMDATRIMTNDMLASQLKVAADKAQSPLAQAEAKKAIGELEMKNGLTIQQWSARKALMQSAGQPGSPLQTQDPTSYIRLVVPKEEQATAFKEMNELKQMSKYREEVLKGFDQISKLNTLGSRIGSPIQSSSQIDAIKGPLTAGLSKQTAGRFTEQDAQMLSPLFPNLKDNAQTVAEKRKKIQDLFAPEMEKSKSVLEGYSIPISKMPQFATEQPDTIERLDPKSGRTVIYDAKTKQPLRWK